MFYEALLALIELDLAFFIDVLFGNLHYIVVFAFIMYYFYDGKDIIAGVIIIICVLWTLDAVAMNFDWPLFVGGFLSVFYISKLAVLTLAENSEFFSKYIVLISSLQGYIVWVLYVMFLA